MDSNSHTNDLLAALPEERIRHVYPTFGVEHVTDKRADCWCGPRVEIIDGGAIIIHEVGH